MQSEITYSIWDRKISWADALLTVAKLLKKRNFVPTDDFVRATIVVNPIKSLSLKTFDETVEVLRRIQSFHLLQCMVTFRRHKAKGKSHSAQEIDVTLTVIDNVKLAIAADDYDLVEGIHNEVSEELHLRNPSLPSSSAPLHLQPTVFVARHFDESGDKAFSGLHDFLSLLGLDVKQGAEYQSRDIPDKVRDRIDSQDIFVALVTGTRDHAWLNAEPAYAKAKGKHVILLVEEGAKYDPTILGRDLEQIRFPVGLVEKSFVSLLREFRSVRVKGL